MCIIIDANVTGDLLPPSDDAQPIIDAIQERKMFLVIGGENTRELSVNRRVGQWLRELLRANVARVVPKSDIEREEKILLELRQHQSNDVHILALARASGARLLFSRDNALGQDFKNKSVLDTPRGTVYKRRSHAHLLKSAPCRRRRPTHSPVS